MDPKEKLKALAAEAATLAAKAATADFTEEDAERAEAIAKEHADLTALVERQAKAARMLGGLSAAVEDNTGEQPGEPTMARSLGEAFTSSEAYHRAKEIGFPANGAPINITAKGIGTRGARRRFKADPAPLARPGQDLPPTQLPGVDDLVYRPKRRLLDLIYHGTTDASSVQYRQVISKTNNAAVVPESTSSTGVKSLKPLSTLTTRMAKGTSYTYADGMEVTNQELRDDGIMAGLINSTLTENLDILTEDVLLNADGSDDLPIGLFHTTGVLQQDYVTDAQVSVRKAITLLRNTSGADIKGVALNPEDDEAWDLLKDADGRYLGSGPYASGIKTAWGYERVECPALPIGTALIGDFSTIHLLDREPLSITAFNQHKDYAQRNLVYIRAEQDAMQLFRAPAKLCLIDVKGN